MGKIGTSQNGWPVQTPGLTEGYVRVTVQGIGFWAANEDVALVLSDYAEWFHRNVERLDLPVKEKPGYDDWSLNVRAVRGQTRGYSNHASATAWDLNATRHPRGVHNTFTLAQRAKMAARRAYYNDSFSGRCVIRLGEFYSAASTIDGMHVEINADAPTVRRVANKIREDRKKSPTKPTPIIATGDDMDWSEKHKQTAADAAALGGKEGDDRSVGAFIRFPSAVQAHRKETKAAFAAQAAQIKALTAAVQALAANSPTAVKAAFDEGVANLKAELADIDVQVTLGDKEVQA